MKSKAQLRLWVYFTAVIFVILLATAFLMFFVTIIFFRLGYIDLERGVPHAFFIVLLTISVTVGTVISLFVAKKILKPITIVSEASNEVSKGNFNIRLDETNRIMEIQELCRNFNLMAQELSGIETLRNDFVVNVSHEFKTPIAAIEGFATLLQDSCLPEQERGEYAKMIIDSARQLAALSGNILALSKLESQEIILEKKLYRLDEQIRQAILLLEPQWGAKGHDLQIDMPNMMYCGNERLMSQVWMNLIGNAVKFTPDGGKINLQLTSDEKAAVVRLADSGCGMEESVVKHIFDKFYQGDAARNSDGNGLGLALAKRIVELCGGEIRVKSDVGKGSVFTVLLPHK